ncbi:hypothetical protein [Tissierella praeacuta]|uniref:Uncharacterized protein n=1 Tax=Tissierella praeacuta DSM 18095 TaxID=1123404 RepID=A0A1M4WKR3_9FIRM|nr:hypothetical protein [Tissierella praeacuta]MBU5255617.1 hypothetical protein [Tissierella praeacuta]TCU79102.1 hypothetical protein EV204_10178 [Tissierella praeacuta]SHE81552.1 hypothetical protein SAMN02745784_01897 [Tissierella praeacuta DSM 18095]SUO99358.1 Uncharacterised protein [Tissierella praeacuta]
MNVYDEYVKDVTKIGRFTMLLGLVVSFLPPAVMTWGFGFNPGLGAIIAGAVSQMSVSGAFYFSEPISYFPIVGRAGLYMGFLSGNLVNMRIPAAVSAVEGSGYKSGTDEGAIMGTIGIGVSIWVGIIFLLLAVFAGQTVLSALPESFMKMLSLIIPALFGGVFAQFAIKSPKTGAFALAIAFIMTKVVSFIPGKPSFIVTLVAVFSTIAFAKGQLSKQIDSK